MKKTIIWIASVIGAGAVMSLVFNAIEAPSVPRTVSVRGECLTTAPRDKTAITLRVTALDKSAAISMKKATAQVAQITDFLKSQDVQMQTTQFNSYEKTEWNHDLQKSVDLGIETTIAVEVSSKNIETIERVLNEFAGLENVYSENLRMYTSAEVLKPIMEKCLGTAIENARERAGAIVAGDGKRVGKLIAASYETGGGNSAYQNIAPRVMGMGKMVATESSFDTSGSLVSKDTDVSVAVSATFEIK